MTTAKPGAGLFVIVQACKRMGWWHEDVPAGSKIASTIMHLHTGSAVIATALRVSE